MAYNMHTFTNHFLYSADVSTSKRESSSYQNSLAVEREQNNVLRAKVDTLSSQVDAQKKDLADVLHSESQMRDELETSDTQKMKELTTLKAKVISSC